MEKHHRVIFKGIPENLHMKSNEPEEVDGGEVGEGKVFVEGESLRLQFFRSNKGLPPKVILGEEPNFRDFLLSNVIKEENREELWSFKREKFSGFGKLFYVSDQFIIGLIAIEDRKLYLSKVIPLRDLVKGVSFKREDGLSGLIGITEPRLTWKLKQQIADEEGLIAVPSADEEKYCKVIKRGNNSTEKKMKTQTIQIPPLFKEDLKDASRLKKWFQIDEHNEGDLQRVEIIRPKNEAHLIALPSSQHESDSYVLYQILGEKIEKIGNRRPIE